MSLVKVIQCFYIIKRKLGRGIGKGGEMNGLTKGYYTEKVTFKGLEPFLADDLKSKG
jgi:hypothetical protein